MGITLSSRDESLVRQVSARLLDPLSEPVDQWRRGICGMLKDLVGADTATFVLPNPESPAFFSEEYELQTLVNYGEILASMESRFHLTERMLAMGVSNRATLYRPYEDELLASAYYNEIIVPNRAFDYLGMCQTTGSDGSYSQILVHHQSESAEPFGPRGLAIFHLLFPAFEAAIRICTSVQSIREDIHALIDTIPSPLALYTDRGRLLHLNPAARSLARANRMPPLIQDEAGRVAANVGARRLRRRGVGSGDAPVVVEVRSTSGQYRILGCRAGAVPGLENLVLISIARTAPIRRPAEACAGLGLTPRQTQVALLLAERRTNREIADELAISVHTAKRHAEQVFAKLGCSSRTQVAQRLGVDSEDARSMSALD